MFDSKARSQSRPLAAQRGAALLVGLLILMTTFALVLAGSIASSAIQRMRHDEVTTRALAEAKRGLIAWSVMRNPTDQPSVSARPGDMPCPDMTNLPGSPLFGTAAATCSPGDLGYFPWRTVGTGPLTDSAGAPLWYAVDGAFKWGLAFGAHDSKPINSDTVAVLKVKAEDGVTDLSSSAIAVIFAPGGALAGQSRAAGNAVCGATGGTSRPRQRCADNYLEASTGINNAKNTGPFISGAPSATFNDRLVWLTVADVMPGVERRVLTSVKRMLTPGSLPNPAQFNDPGCRDNDTTTTCQSAPSVCRGILPELPAMSATWIGRNHWYRLVYYAVGLNAAPNCTAAQTVTGVGPKQAVLIAMGAARAGQVRGAPYALRNYLDDTANQSGWSGSGPGADVTVPPSATSNDQMVTIP